MESEKVATVALAAIGWGGLFLVDRYNPGSSAAILQTTVVVATVLSLVFAIQRRADRRRT